MIARVGGVAVRRVRREAAFFFVAGFAFDADGAPKAYHRDDAKALDLLENAGHEGNWWALVVDGRGEPIVQGRNDPAPGYFVSTTSLFDATKPVRDPRRYVDSTRIRYIALPPRARRNGRARMGDFAVVWNRRNGRVANAILADEGPPNEIGEGSIALARTLAIPGNPKTGGPTADVAFLVFPRSGNGKTRSAAEITTRGSELFHQWGGLDRLRALTGP